MLQLPQGLRREARSQANAVHIFIFSTEWQGRRDLNSRVLLRLGGTNAARTQNAMVMRAPVGLRWIVFSTQREAPEFEMSRKARRALQQSVIELPILAGHFLRREQ
jgi:hypothetical protein